MIEKIDAIEQVLEDLDKDTLISVWNAYCSNNGSDEDIIYVNDECTINEILECKTPFWIVCSVLNYNSSDDYFINGINGIETFTDIDEKICIEDLSRAIERDYTILSDNSDEGVWYDSILDNFKEYGRRKGIEAEEPYDCTELLYRDWDYMLENQ